jgi:hypothetical protein
LIARNEIRSRRLVEGVNGATVGFAISSPTVHLGRRIKRGASLLRDNFLRVGREFAAARQEALTGHPLAQVIRVVLPGEVRDALDDVSGDLIVEGSPGVGNWAFVPWVSVFDPALINC